MADLYGVIGFPVKHSLLPVMFKAAFWEYRMDEEYEQFEVSPERLEDFLRERVKEGHRHSLRLSGAGGVFDEVRGGAVRGLSVAIPHKETIAGLLDRVDKHAEVIGAVNTVRLDKVAAGGRGRLKGYNTDWIGAQKAIEEVLDVAGKEVVILGAGGAAAAVGYACVEMGARVTILNRNVERALVLAARLGGAARNCHAANLDDILHHPAHLLVHTTSAGMGTDEGRSMVPPEYFRRGMFVFDMAYTPVETQLLKEAARYGCRTIPGYKMLLYQAEKQFEIWFDKKPRLEKMEEALLEELGTL